MNPVFSYLVRMQGSKEIGRFHAPDAGSFHRGETVVVLSHRGLEKGEVVTRCQESHDVFFPAQSAGKLLRAFTPEDERQSQRLHSEAEALISQAQQLADKQQIPMMVLEADILMDEQHAIIRVARKPASSIQDWIADLSRTFGKQVFIEEESPEVKVSCGDGSCGSEGKGCGSCGSGGCGSCTSK